MINLSALNNDPWSTIPVKKDDLRNTAKFLEFAKKEAKMYEAAFNVLCDVMEEIARQKDEPKSQKLAQDALLW